MSINFFEFLDTVPAINWEEYNLSREQVLLATTRLFLRSLSDYGIPIFKDKRYGELYTFQDNAYEKITKKAFENCAKAFAMKIGVENLRTKDFSQLLFNIRMELFATCTLVELPKVDIKQRFEREHKKELDYYLTFDDLELWYAPNDMTKRYRDNRSYQKNDEWHVYPMAKVKDCRKTNQRYYFVCPLCGMLHNHGFDESKKYIEQVTHKSSDCGSYRVDRNFNGYFVHRPKKKN